MRRSREQRTYAGGVRRRRRRLPVRCGLGPQRRGCWLIGGLVLSVRLPGSFALAGVLFPLRPLGRRACGSHGDHQERVPSCGTRRLALLQFQGRSSKSRNVLYPVPRALHVYSKRKLRSPSIQTVRTAI